MRDVSDLSGLSGRAGILAARLQHGEVRCRGASHLCGGGEALDNHEMVAIHGWSMQMVAVKGTQTLAQKYHYIGDMHVKEHHHSSYALPLDEN